MTEATVYSRSEVDPKLCWDPQSIYPSAEAWEGALDSLLADLSRLEAYKGRLAEGAGVLADALAVRDELHQRLGHVFVYASMSHSVDTMDQAAAGMMGRAESVRARFLAASAFVIPEIIDLTHARVVAWADEEPRLAEYRHYFDDLFRKAAHYRTTEVEELLGLAADPLESIEGIFGVLVSADMSFAPVTDSQGRSHELTRGTTMFFSQSADREMRRTAWENTHRRYGDFKNSLTGTLAASIKKNVFITRARGHAGSLEMALFDNHIPPAVFHNLLEVFKNHLPTWHRYFRLRRQALGVETLCPYDLWAPLLGDQPPLSYEAAVEMICQGLAPMGSAYVDQVRRGCLEERWVDVLPTRGKRSGAFSSGEQGTPPFIVMNWTGSMVSLSTLAHELGHSMHSYLTWHNQPHVYADYSIFVAEVASNFHQALVRDHLLAGDGDRAFKIAVIEEAMSNFLRYFFIMPLLARFEVETHGRIEAGQALTADGVSRIMADLLEEGFGGEVEIEPERDGMHWANYGHVFADYYVYQYATGISAAHALSGPILKGEAGAVDRYLSFLKAGASLYPIDALKLAGVDLSQPEPVESTFDVLAARVDQLEALLSEA